MGRPRDEFSWKQVEVSNDGWKCKYCREDFKGSASRIRNHLSGQGNDISACAAVPDQIRNEALKKVTRKRPLQISSSSSTTSLGQGPSPSSSNGPGSFTKMATEEYVTDAFIKFLIMCSSSSSAICNVINDPYFREYLERAHKYGVASSILWGDSLVVEKSLLNIKQEVHQYMVMVTESWKTTGCTVMTYYLIEEKQKLISTSQKNKYVYGFYCPKGFIFVEGTDSHPNYKSFLDALRLHSPRLDNIGDVTFKIYHDSAVDHDLGNCHSCEFSDNGKSLYDVTEGLVCLREEIQRICIKVCSCSQWAQGLINKAIRIHELLKWNLEEWYEKWLKKNGKRFKREENIKATETSGLSNFLLIMLLEHDLKEKSSYLKFENLADVDSKFWGDGRKLQRVLNLILKIPDLLDTLVPTAGYIAIAIDKVKSNIFRIYEKTAEEDALVFLQDLGSQLEKITFTEDWDAARYLNPVYFLQEVQRKMKSDLLDVLVRYYSWLENEVVEVDEEWKLYCNVFSNLADIDLKSYHPVKLWEKYGHDLPILRKLAIKVLSQPVTCLCNQVKKHMYQLQGADDFILRLNVRMMEEFKLLGDDIYKPIDLSQLEYWYNR